MNRRKVLIYLRPDTHAGERFADTRIEAHHRGDRGELSRTALLAGIALGEIDSRLPSVLAAMLADNTDAEALRTLLTSFLNIRSAAPSHPADAVAKPPVAIPVQHPGNLSATNLSGMLPE